MSVNNIRKLTEVNLEQLFLDPDLVFMAKDTSALSISGLNR